jgi:perosamine synthetase
MSQGRQVTVGDFKAGPKEFEYINQVLASGRLSYGPFGKRFEKEWAEAHGCKHAVFCNSGTSALHIAVQALKNRHGWRDGDEVLVPSVTFVATANVCLHNGLKPVFVDVDRHTYNIDPLKIEEKIVPGTTRAIVPVHLCGQPADMPTIQQIAWRYGLQVIEDSCETAFADCGGKPVGSWGDVACFSTYMAHYIVTGVGGLATTNDPELAKDLRSLMNHGRDGIYISIDDDDGKTGAELKEMISRRFKFIEAGHSFRCTELEAALGCAQLERKAEIVERRKRTAYHYTAGLRDLHADGSLQTPFVHPSVDHVFMMYPIVTDTPETKTALTQYLEEHGIETRDLLPLLNQPVYHKLFGRRLIDQYPVAKKLDGCGFYIGTHQYITDDDAAYVVDTIKRFFRGVSK